MSKHNEEGNNNKHKGEQAEIFVIADFTRLGIGVALPISDNLPFDFIAVKDNKLFKVQVKASSTSDTAGSISFSLKTSNWWKKTEKKYTIEEVDIFACYDLVDKTTYLLGPENFDGKGYISIRKEVSKNGQIKRCHFAKDYVLSEKRISELLI